MTKIKTLARRIAPKLSKGYRAKQAAWRNAMREARTAYKAAASGKRVVVPSTGSKLSAVRAKAAARGARAFKAARLARVTKRYAIRKPSTKKGKTGLRRLRKGISANKVARRAFSKTLRSSQKARREAARRGYLARSKLRRMKPGTMRRLRLEAARRSASQGIAAKAAKARSERFKMRLAAARRGGGSGSGGQSGGNGGASRRKARTTSGGRSDHG